MNPDRDNLLSGLRLGHRQALARVERAIRDSRGSMLGAAQLLGIGIRTLYDLRDELPAVAEILSQHAIGRSGEKNSEFKARAAKSRPADKSAAGIKNRHRQP